MEIRKRITYQFIGIVAFILFITFLSIYFSFSQARKEEFYDRLSSKAKLVGQMLIDIDEIDSELLKRIEKNNPLNLPNEKIIIYDFTNTVIYSSDVDNSIIISDELIQDVRLDERIRFRQKPYEILGEFYIGQYDRIVVFAAATDIFGLNKLKWLRIIMGIVFIISLAIVYFAGRLFAHRALQPISSIVSKMNKIGISNLNERLDEGNGTDELALLSKTFNSMLLRLEAAFKTQKNFIANASHELRTPLTVITGQIEVILMKARKNEEYRETLMVVLNEIKDLNQISNKLLLLAQASSDRSEIHFTRLRIDDIIWQAQNEIVKRNPNYDIQISFSENIDDEDKLTLPGNEILMKTTVLNLIDNACKYSSGLPVIVTLEANNNSLSIKVKDRGPGIPFSEQKMIFQPFYRSEKTMKIEGHGIGLSLVEKIIQLHKGTIQLFSEEGKGSEFIVTFPY